MGVGSLRSSVSLSVLVHAFFLIACAALLAKRAAELPREKLTWIELTPTLRPGKITDQSRERQVVQTHKGKEVAKALPDSFLGERTQVVDQETVSKTRQMVAEQKASKRQASKKDTTDTKDTVPTIGALGIPIVSHLKKLNEQPASENDRGNWVGQGSEGLRAQDYVRGLKQGETTALNTREFVFFGYYQRIRERLDRAWVPILRERLVRYYRSGRQLASNMEHTTRVLVVMNGQGEIVRVQMVSESGTRDLDEAAVRAFNRAGPFPNPPKGIVSVSGEIEIPWEFVLRT